MEGEGIANANKMGEITWMAHGRNNHGKFVLESSKLVHIWGLLFQSKKV